MEGAPRQKAEAEGRLLALGNLISIVRFTKILTPETQLFKGWLKSLRNNEAIHPFSDMVMAPVSLAFAVDVLCRIGEVLLPDVLQVSGDKDITYEQIAMHIVERIGCKPSLVQAIASIEACLNAEAVPVHTTLDTSRLHVELKMRPPNIWPLIDSVVDM